MFCGYDDYFPAISKIAMIWDRESKRNHPNESGIEERVWVLVKQRVPVGPHKWSQDLTTLLQFDTLDPYKRIANEAG